MTIKNAQESEWAFKSGDALPVWHFVKNPIFKLVRSALLGYVLYKSGQKVGIMGKDKNQAFGMATDIARSLTGKSVDKQLISQIKAGNVTAGPWIKELNREVATIKVDGKIAYTVYVTSEKMRETWVSGTRIPDKQWSCEVWAKGQRRKRDVYQSYAQAKWAGEATLTKLFRDAVAEHGSGTKGKSAKAVKAKGFYQARHPKYGQGYQRDDGTWVVMAGGPPGREWAIISASGTRGGFGSANAAIRAANRESGKSAEKGVDPGGLGATAVQFHKSVSLNKNKMDKTLVRQIKAVVPGLTNRQAKQVLAAAELIGSTRATKGWGRYRDMYFREAKDGSRAEYINQGAMGKPGKPWHLGLTVKLPNGNNDFANGGDYATESEARSAGDRFIQQHGG